MKNVTIEEATEIVRKALPNRLIWCATEFKDYYVFLVAVDNNYRPFDLTLSSYKVDKKTAEISRAERPKITDPVRESIRRVMIDITQEQYDKTGI